MVGAAQAFLVDHSAVLEASISPTAMPAPMRLHSTRNGRSVTPAIGATTKRFLRVYGPICMLKIQ